MDKGLRAFAQTRLSEGLARISYPVTPLHFLAAIAGARRVRPYESSKAQHLRKESSALSLNRVELVSFGVCEFDFSMLVGADSTVHKFVLGIESGEVLSYTRIRGKCAAHVVDLAAQIQEIFARKKENSAYLSVLGRYVDEVTRWGCPHRVKLRLHEHTGKFPESPSKHWATTVPQNGFINKRKAFVCRSALYGANDDINWFDTRSKGCTQVGQFAADFCGSNRIQVAAHAG